jgi:hypothetical protein
MACRFIAAALVAGCRGLPDRRVGDHWLLPREKGSQLYLNGVLLAGGRPRQSEGLPRCDPGSALPSSKYRADGSYLQRKAEVKKDRAMLNGVAGAYDTPQDRLSGFFLGFDLDDEINVVSDGA